MKKQLLTLATAGLMSVSAASFAGMNPYNLTTTDYANFTLINADPVGSVNAFYWNMSNDEFSIVWNIPDILNGDPVAYIGDNSSDLSFLMGYDSLTANIQNSSGEEVNFSLFVEYMADGGAYKFDPSPLSFVTLADNESATLELDFSTDSNNWDSVLSFGILTQAIANDNVTHVSVPEPSSIATLGAGLLALSLVARRRKSAQK